MIDAIPSSPIELLSSTNSNYLSFGNFENEDKRDPAK